MKPTGRIDEILKTLKDFGPMTRADLEISLNLNKAQTSRLMDCIITASKQLPQRAHISGYVYDQEGQKRYPRATYAFGEGLNAEKPIPDKKAIQKRSRKKRISLLSSNSVFNLALGIPYATRKSPKRRKSNGNHNQDISGC